MLSLGWERHDLAKFVILNSAGSVGKSNVRQLELDRLSTAQSPGFFLSICIVSLYSSVCLFVFSVFIEFVTILLLFYVLIFGPRGMWDLSSWTRDRTRTPCIGRQSLNHWTAREVPSFPFD